MKCLFQIRNLTLCLLSGLVNHVLCVNLSLALGSLGLVNFIYLIKLRLGKHLWHLNIYFMYL